MEIEFLKEHPGVPCRFVSSHQGSGYVILTQAEIDEIENESFL